MASMSDLCIMQLTAPSMGAIAVIGVWGESALRPFGVSLTPGQRKRIRFADDDALLVCVREDYAELHLHGGLAVVAGAMQALQAAGAWVIPVNSAEAVQLLGGGVRGEVAVVLPGAVTRTAAMLLAAQTTGGLSTWCEMAGALPSAWHVQCAAQALLTRSEDLNWLIEPARVAIIGEPNAGKSTLANALLGRDASITSPIAGTTRDWVDHIGIFSNGVVEAPVCLVDTAGVRSTDDHLEAASIVRTHAQAREADVVVVLLDGTHAPPAEIADLLETHADRAIVAISKCDVAGDRAWAREFGPVVEIAATQHRGLEQLCAITLERLGLAAVAADEPWAFTLRQRQLIEQIAVTDDMAEIGRLLQVLQHG